MHDSFLLCWWHLFRHTLPLFLISRNWCIITPNRFKYYFSCIMLMEPRSLWGILIGSSNLVIKVPSCFFSTPNQFLCIVLYIWHIFILYSYSKHYIDVWLLIVKEYHGSDKIYIYFTRWQLFWKSTRHPREWFWKYAWR